MADSQPDDAWHAGDRYEAYMGRWSRRVAPRFLDWLDAPAGADWIDVGSGTGALSAAILAQCDPRSTIGIDPSEGFVDTARLLQPDPRANFRVGDAQALPVGDATCDVAASALVLNFVPDRAKALSEFLRVVRPGGRIAFYVWDYPGDGVELISRFWGAATALDPKAADLDEARRFPFCTRQGLEALARDAGLGRVETTPIEIATVFADFADYWRPFMSGTGPAPGYCMSLEPAARDRLRQRLAESLPKAGDGSIHLSARAWALKATRP